MALINKDDNSYIRIFLDISFISQSGIHCHIVTYKNKAERARDKEFAEYMLNILPKIIEERKAENKPVNGLEDLLGRYTGFGPRVFWSNGSFFLDSLFEREEKVEQLKEIGFDFSIRKNPIRIISEEDKLCAEFNKEDLTLENLYPLLKKNFNCNSDSFELVIKEDTSEKFLDD